MGAVTFQLTDTGSVRAQRRNRFGFSAVWHRLSLIFADFRNQTAEKPGGKRHGTKTGYEDGNFSGTKTVISQRILRLPAERLRFAMAMVFKGAAPYTSAHQFRCFMLLKAFCSSTIHPKRTILRESSASPVFQSEGPKANISLAHGIDNHLQTNEKKLLIFIMLRKSSLHKSCFNQAKHISTTCSIITDRDRVRHCIQSTGTVT
ncbi:hypothetical protein [Acinetobacter baumannii]|uniref:hypothetical protein n=1 Tax=Acinetobacter baumannii TaxID=470 RepID=UPI00313B638C